MSKRKEIWVDLRDWEAKYQVSDQSRIRSKKTGLTLKPMLTGSDYYYFMFYNERKKKRKKVFLHRAVAMHFVPNPYCHNEVNHMDGNKLNCDKSNLEWCSRSENSKHAIRMGLHRPHFMDGSSKGELNANAKMTWDKVRIARKEVGEASEDRKKEVIQKLADEFDVCKKTILDIVANRSWKE